MTNSIPIFENFNECFFCNSKIHGKKVHVNYETNPYIKPLQKKYSLSSEYISKNLILIKCQNCKVLSFQRWFSKEIGKEIYKIQKHRMGWFLFKNYTNNSFIEYFKNDLKLYEDIINEIGYYDSQLEIHCPFQGFFQLFNLINNKVLIDNYSFNSNLFKFFIFFNNFRMRNNKNFVDKILNIKKTKKNFFIKFNSSYGWGQKCNFLKTNCYEVIKQSNWETYLDLDEDFIKKNNIDILFLRNTLDHVDKPLEKFASLCLIVKYIYIDTHFFNKNNIQHNFFFTNETFDFLKKEFGLNTKKKFSNNRFLFQKI